MKIIVALSILILLILLISNKIKPFILFGSVAVLYYLLGYLNLNTWLSSYTSESLIVLILLLLVSLAIEKSAVIAWCSKFIIGKNYHLSLLKLGVITASISAFLNNTAVVASFMSIIKNNKFQAPSKLLIPLSYFSIVGGTMTLIGTSTNLIVNSFVVQNGLQSLKIFDFFAVGFCISIGVLIVLLIFSFLLPEYKEKENAINEYLINAKVLKNSSLVGKTIQENGLRNLEFLFLFEIQRQDEIISPVSHDEIIKEGDVLIFSGDITHLETLKKFDGLQMGAQEIKLETLNLVDVVINSESSLIGKSVLQAGDRLILSVGKDFHSRDNINKNFYIISNIIQNQKLSNAQSFIVVFAFLAIIALSALEIVSLLKALLVFLAFLFVFKFISFDEIKRRFPLEIFIIVGSSLAITKVLVDSGLAKDFADLIIGTFGAYGLYGSFVGIYLLTLLLTEIITNNAAAALAFPIAYSTALALEVNPVPFILAVAYGASCGFMMPHGYQTHLMVGSICGYKTTDFVKIGWIVSLTYSAMVLIMTPIFFKF